MTARVIPPILRRGSQRRFTHVKRETCIGGMTLAVVLEMVPYYLSWCEWERLLRGPGNHATNLYTYPRFCYNT
jgi:hypothetical protein